MGDMSNQMLSRVPKGFPANHPAADHLRAKHWIYYEADIPVDLAVSKELLDEFVKRAKALAPVVDFLNAPLRTAAASTAAVRDFFE